MRTIIYLVIAFICSSAHSTELISLKDYLKKELASHAKMAKETFNISPSDAKTLSKLAPGAQDKNFTFYYGKSAQDKIEKACTVVPQAGKEGPIVMGVCFNMSGLIAGATVLSSEEERGKKIAEESFLKQFKGKKVSDAFHLGEDVDGISGATWSSKAVAEVMRKTAFAFKTYVKGKK